VRILAMIDDTKTFFGVFLFSEVFIDFDLNNFI